MAHISCEAGRVLLRHKAMFEQFRTADDGLERGFQLMGDVGRKFTATALGFGLLRHVNGQ